MLHRRVRVQGHSLTGLLLLRVQYLYAVRQFSRSIVLLILLYMGLSDKLLLTLGDVVLLLLLRVPLTCAFPLGHQRLLCILLHLVLRWLQTLHLFLLRYLRARFALSAGLTDLNVATLHLLARLAFAHDLNILEQRLTLLRLRLLPILDEILHLGHAFRICRCYLIT